MPSGYRADLEPDAKLREVRDALISVEEAAEKMGVSPRLVKDAHVVFTRGTEEEKQKVKERAVSVTKQATNIRA